MARRGLNKLTALGVQRAKTTGYFSDGGNLYLRVSEYGTKSWLFVFTRNGKTREMGLGPYPDVTLEEARQKAREARKVLIEGEDPITKRQTERNEQRLATAKVTTFKQAAEQYIELHSASWKNEKHAAQWASTLETYAYPIIGDLACDVINVALVKQILTPIWNTKSETASRLRGRIELVLRSWAADNEIKGYDNPAKREALNLPKHDASKIKNHPALAYEDVADFIAALRQQEGIAAKALELAILTACRSGEVRGAKRSEFDLGKKVWTIPGSRMKSKKEHRVPLSGAAIKIIEATPQIAGTDLLFPSAKVDKPLSDMTLTAVIRRMDTARKKSGGTGWLDPAGELITVHGFRSTFRDWAGETTPFPREVIEHALAHQLKDKAEAAYARGTLFDKRAKLMEQWAGYCETRRVPGKVIEFTGERIA